MVGTGGWPFAQRWQPLNSAGMDCRFTGPATELRDRNIFDFIGLSGRCSQRDPAEAPQHPDDATRPRKRGKKRHRVGGLSDAAPLLAWSGTPSRRRSYGPRMNYLSFGRAGLASGLLSRPACFRERSCWRDLQGKGTGPGLDKEVPGAALHLRLGPLGDRQTQGRCNALPVSETSVKDAARDLAALPEASLIPSPVVRCSPR